MKEKVEDFVEKSAYNHLAHLATPTQGRRRFKTPLPQTLTPIQNDSEAEKQSESRIPQYVHAVSSKQQAQHLCHLSRSPPQMNVDTRPELPLPLIHEQGSDDDDIYSEPRFSGVESRGPMIMPNTSDSDNYVAMTSYDESTKETDLSTPQPGPGAQIVTGVSRKGLKSEKPTTRPKPKKTRTEGSSCGPKTSTVPLQQLVIGANEIQKRKSTLKRAGTTKPLSDQLPPESRSTNSSVDTADYTGGSCTGGEGTGEYTGDSGFGDATPFLKVDIAGSQPTARPTGARPLSASGSGYYKTMGTPDSVEGYITVTRDSNTDQADDWYRPTDVKHMNDDEVEYMYVKMH
jgi:hypothetical protein